MRIEIAMAADQAYSDLLLVAATSVALSARKDIYISYTFLDGGLSDGFYSYMVERLAVLHTHITCCRYKVDESRFKTFPNWRGNKMAYARFLLPELLPHVSHVIYCDVDFLWLRDIGELWEQRDDRIALQAVHDPQVHESPESSWFVKHGFVYKEERYFCTGLLMMNLDMFRTENIVESVYHFINDHPDVLFPDQSSLNIILDGRVKILDSHWMYFTRYVGFRELNHPCVLHYVNDLPNIPGRSKWIINKDIYMAWHYINGKAYGMTMFDSLKRTCGVDRIWNLKLLYYVTRIFPFRQILIVVAYIVRRGIYVYLREHYCYRISHFKMFLSD